MEIKEYTEETVDITVELLKKYGFFDNCYFYSMKILKSEVAPIYLEKGLPIHMYCADNDEDVDFCIRKGAALITANDPIPLMKRLGRI